MRPPPATIDEATVLEIADLTHSTATGRTLHVGQDSSGFAALAIARYADDRGVDMFYCDAIWQAVNDTYHDEVPSGKRQAEFEFSALRWMSAR